MKMVVRNGRVVRIRLLQHEDVEPLYDYLRLLSSDATENNIVAYMLISQGMTEADRQRYSERNQYFDPVTTVTFAPWVGDAWQSTGLGFAMANIEEDLRKKSIRHVILWGGVQTTNFKALNYYKKLGYEYIDSFWFGDIDNHDMMKEL